MLIAVCLAVAEPLVDRNTRQLMINGTIAASVGLVGGVAAALVVEKLYNALANGLSDGGIAMWQQMLARSLTWGILGMFLTIAPGLVMRNSRKLMIGLFGGLIGGLVGGALFDPVASWTDNTHLSRGVALIAIGLVAGGCTGLIENAAKTGWLKVTAGLIAGKQFILYRNPTFIGSGPECQIYLFRDAKVGRRHAAVHLVPGGIELENLPLGATTLVNGKPVERVRLRHGDTVQIGGTGFLFQEKKRSVNCDDRNRDENCTGVEHGDGRQIADAGGFAPPHPPDAMKDAARRLNQIGAEGRPPSGPKRFSPPPQTPPPLSDFPSNASVRGG